MKSLFLLFTFPLLLICISNIVLAQNPREAEIKRLENIERESVLKSDSAALFGKIWSPTMVIHTLVNVVGTVEGTKQLFRTGALTYLSFERSI